MSTVAFFEISWSIITTIGIGNVFFGLLVCGITNFTLIAAVPIISSGAGAIANGLCFYVNYGEYPRRNKAIASVFGDVFWLVQETSLLFYSYIILRRVLRNTRLKVFYTLFWLIIAGIVVSRVLIAIFRVKFILSDDLALQGTVNHFHTVYFGLMALQECISAYFLLVIFASARASSLNVAPNVSLFQYLSRSTEVRVAILALQGIFRSVTHSFQAPGQETTNIASQLGRFAYTIFCLYPTVLYIDLLASKLSSVDHQTHSSQNLPSLRSRRHFTNTQKDSFVAGRAEHVVELHQTHQKPSRSDSQERICTANSSPVPSIRLESLHTRGSGIQKTVEITVTR